VDPANEMLRLRNRMLLSNTSGLAYDFSTPALQKYPKSNGEEHEFGALWTSYLTEPLVSRCKRAAPRCRQRIHTNRNHDLQKVRPLLFEPGEGWVVVGCIPALVTV
jgi:hypothetical protein